MDIRTNAERLARLGLAEQAHEVACNRDKSLCLVGDGTLTIAGQNGAPDLVLGLQQFAELVNFLHSPRVNDMLPAILLAALRDQGGAVADTADLVMQAVNAGLAKEVLYVLKQEQARRAA